MKNQVREYFQFTKKERAGILVLLVSILAAGFAPAFFESRESFSDSAALKKFSEHISVLDRTAKDSVHAGNYQGRGDRNVSADRDGAGVYNYRRAGSEPIRPAPEELFYFDPNTIDEAGWIKLGLRAKTAGTIIKYRNAGGKFRRPEDLQKIFGISPADRERLIPFVRLSSPGGRAGDDASHSGNLTRAGTGNLEKDSKRYERKTYSELEINKADSTDWMKFPGIGPGLSGRILKYRNKLGGFYSPDQVKEVYGLPDSVYQKIRPWLKCGSSPARIQLNEISRETLERHPYMNRTLAAAIIGYREQHGQFRSVDDLKMLVLVTDEIFRKISPYIKI